MTIQQLIQLANRRISYLTEMRIAAERIGDADSIARYDAEIEQTQDTLNQLLTL
ncbi:MAG: hypothetical protein ACK5VE_04870 [Alphaproteobacteria bacterium]|jgi:hypothetical protein